VPTRTLRFGASSPGFPAAHDIEVLGSGLEEAFLALTADANDLVQPELETR
jgi:hypothetical protein